MKIDQQKFLLVKELNILLYKNVIAASLREHIAFDNIELTDLCTEPGVKVFVSDGNRLADDKRNFNNILLNLLLR